MLCSDAEVESVTAPLKRGTRVAWDSVTDETAVTHIDNEIGRAGMTRSTPMHWRVYEDDERKVMILFAVRRDNKC